MKLGHCALDAFDQLVEAHFMWTFRNEIEDRWSYPNSYDKGWIKHDPTLRELNGVYSDPNHPSCPRTVTVPDGDSFQVFGFDAAAGEGFPCNGEDDIAWGPLPGKITNQDTNAVVVDFSSKGGPTDLSGTFMPVPNPPFILWEDGNEWPKMYQSGV